MYDLPSRTAQPVALGLVYAGTPKGLVYACNIRRIFRYFSDYQLKIE
jgi:hypothetical protein